MHPPAPPAPPARPRWPLVVVQAVWVLFLPVWFALTVAATMGLANHDAWWSPLALLVVWLYPVAVVAAIAISHALHARRPRAARRWNLLPLPWLVAGLALLVWIFSADFSFS